ncbi:MAG: molybdopterin molybdenumtransferase MoeA [Deltaproteobacteria bacterium]|nr:MAG: molybdopterin molybdenumtransferase MoeA [Deltaproteobacteria bacterium]
MSMLSLEEAQRHILEGLDPLPPERRPVLDAVGRVLAEAVEARYDLPGADNSAMDGYAVRAADLEGPPVRLRVIGVVPAGGRAERPLGPGEAYRIFTGAPVPPGADAVVRQEDTDLGEREVEVRCAVEPGQNIRPRGDDVPAGERLLTPGTILGPAEVAALFAHGRSEVEVVRRPRVAIFATGAELARVDEVLPPGRIIDSNSPAIAAACHEAGAEPLLLPATGDDPGAIEARIDAAGGCDVIVSSGGVSVGEFDYVRKVYEARGLAARLWRVAIKPGKPLLFGRLGRQLVFGLPGNPVSVLATFEAFVRPALRRLAGYRDVHRPRLRARLRREAPAARGRTNLLWGRLERGPEGWEAEVRPRQASHRIRGALEADCLVPVPPDTPLPAGREVEVWALRLPGR